MKKIQDGNKEKESKEENFEKYTIPG